jgi:hypothetical protein
MIILEAYDLRECSTNELGRGQERDQEDSLKIPKKTGEALEHVQDGEEF